MEVSFFLKNCHKEKKGSTPNKNVETPIFLLFHYGYKEKKTNGKEVYKPVKIYIKDKIKPSNWNFDKGKARENFAGHPEFNENLENITSTVKTLYRTLSKGGATVTPEQFKKAWDEGNKIDPGQSDDHFVNFAESHINSITGTVKEGSLKSFRNSLRHIKEFAQSKNISLSIDSIGFDFHYSLIEYLKTEKKFGTNTIWRINKFLRYILKYATEKGKTTRPDYTSKRFSVKSEEPDVIYLNDTDLSKIYNKDFSDKPKLDRVRDLFLIACYTGLRFSDLSKLNQDNIIEFEGVKMLRIKTQKTEHSVTIPINPIVNQIINKYKGKIPKVMSNQKFNDYLKDVASESEVKDKISLNKTKGNLTAPTTFEKCELVTTHTARRTFSTNAFLGGVPTIQIMKVTGHKTEKAFLRYIRIGNDENALILSKHDFFNTVPLKIAE